MRLAIIMNLAPRKLGSFEGWISAMCQNARERGHEVDVYGHEPVHPQFAAKLKAMGIGWAPVKELLEGSAFKAIRRLSRYDVIHLNMYGPRTRIALLAYAAYPAKVMWVDHTSGPVPSERETHTTASAFLRRAADAITEVRITGIVGVSDYVSERNRRRFSPKKVRTIYNGVDVRRFLSKDEFFDLNPPAKPAEDRKDLQILAVAHLIRQKGIDFLIRGLAQAKHKRLRLRVVGDGPELESLKKLAVTLGVEGRVEWLGLRDDVHALLADSDIFVHPAIWEEAFGLTIAEAMSAQKAVIATRIGGIPELIEHERSGLLVRPERAAEIASALDLLSDSAALRRQLGENARLRASQHFNLASCAQEHIRWCEEAAGKPVRLPARSVEVRPQSPSLH